MPASDERVAPIRVLHLIASLGGGGAERQLTLMLRFADASAVSYGVCCYEGGQYLEDVRNSTPHLWQLPRPSRFSLSPAFGLRRVIRDFRPDVIQTWLSYMDIVGSMVARFSTRAPVLASERNTREQYSNNDTPGVLRLRNLCRRYLVAGIVANSEGGRSYLERDVGVRVPISVIKNGLDLEALDRVPPADLAALGITGQPVILSVGRLSESKNLSTLLRALPSLTQRWPQLTVLVCGTGPRKSPLQELAQDLSVNRYVSWLGFRRDVWSLMKSADVLAHAAITEGDPNVAAEAAAARAPLCLSDIPPHREFAEGHDCAAFFPATDPGALARALTDVLGDESRTGERVEVARALAEQRSARSMAREYEALYRSLVPDRSGPPGSAADPRGDQLELISGPDRKESRN